MTRSNSLKKLVSIGAALLLAVGGSLVAAEPASAGVIPTPQTGGMGGGPLFYAAPGTYSEGDTVVVGTGSWNTGMATLTSATHEWFKCTSATASTSDSSVCTPINGGAPVNAATYQGSLLTTTYVIQQSDIGYWLRVKVTAVATVVAGDGGTSVPVTITTTNAVVAAPVATFNANGGTSGSITSLTGNVIWLPSIQHGGSQSLPTRANCFFGGWSSSASSITPENTNSATALMTSKTYYAIWSGSCLTVAPPVTTSTTVVAPVAESAKPLPTWAAPILKQVPNLSKTLTTEGGKVGLSDGDYSSLKSVTIGGKSVAFSIDAKGDVSIPVPAGKGGTSADLVVTFAGGSMVIQDGIKYVTPTDVATVPESGLAGFAKKSAKLGSALTAAILYAAQVDHKANAIQCSGYASSKADIALATARATAACAVATGAYDTLTKSNVVVVVNKAKAKTSPVGIKVYH